MTFPKLLGLIAIFLFGIIALTAVVKKCGRAETPQRTFSLPSPVEVDLEKEIRVIPQKKDPPKPPVSPPSPSPALPPSPKNKQQPPKESSPPKPVPLPIPVKDEVPEVDRIKELFNIEGAKLPIVETITYKSRVSWQKGRPAWLSDYAGHYHTSRHFIARSLRGKPDYFNQEIAEGARFNVFRQEKNFQFYLLVDLSRSKLWLYYDDLDAKERVLLKTYRVGIGRIDEAKSSGYLTPLGKYSLGSKVAIYKQKTMGSYKGQQTEMVKIFGTRWIPFDKELGQCTAPAKGFGIHGVPCSLTDKGEWKQEITSLGKYESDGCIRLATEDMEEVFAIVITKPAIIEIVKDFYSGTPPTW